MEFNEYLAKIRREESLSKRELANKLNVSPATIVRLENGTTKKPTKSLLNKLAKYLNVSTIDILNDLNYQTKKFNEDNSGLLYGNILFMNDFYIQYNYKYNQNISFSCKAIKKRNNNHIILVDGFDSINKTNDTSRNMADALFKVMQVTTLNIQCYTIVFSIKDKKSYEEYSKLKLKGSSFTINLVLLDPIKHKIIKQTSNK